MSALGDSLRRDLDRSIQGKFSTFGKSFIEVLDRRFAQFAEKSNPSFPAPRDPPVDRVPAKDSTEPFRLNSQTASHRQGGDDVETEDLEDGNSPQVIPQHLLDRIKVYEDLVASDVVTLDQFIKALDNLGIVRTSLGYAMKEALPSRPVPGGSDGDGAGPNRRGLSHDDSINIPGPSGPPPKRR